MAPYNADINITWVKQSLDMICHNKFREWLEILANSTLDILFQAKSKFGLNTECQVILRNKLKNSQCCAIRSVYNDTSKYTNTQYDRYLVIENRLKSVLKTTS